MAFLTLHEMLPLAFDYAGQKQAVKAVFVGMAFMSARFVDVSNKVLLICFRSSIVTNVDLHSVKIFLYIF